MGAEEVEPPPTALSSSEDAGDTDGTRPLPIWDARLPELQLEEGSWDGPGAAILSPSASKSAPPPSAWPPSAWPPSAGAGASPSESEESEDEEPSESEESEEPSESEESEEEDSEESEEEVSEEEGALGGGGSLGWGWAGGRLTATCIGVSATAGNASRRCPLMALVMTLALGKADSIKGWTWDQWTQVA